MLIGRTAWFGQKSQLKDLPMFSAAPGVCTGGYFSFVASTSLGRTEISTLDGYFFER